MNFVAFISLNSYGIGIIIRDDAGSFVVAHSQQIQRLVDPYRGELMAAKAGTLFALKFGLELLELKVDAKNVWKSISKGKQDRSYTGNIVRDIHLYSSWVRNCRCKFVPRQCNRMADVLANYAKDI